MQGKSKNSTWWLDCGMAAMEKHRYDLVVIEFGVWHYKGFDVNFCRLYKGGYLVEGVAAA